MTDPKKCGVPWQNLESLCSKIENFHRPVIVPDSFSGWVIKLGEMKFAGSDLLHVIGTAYAYAMGFTDGRGL
jgi:hypothetical protein